MIRNFIGKHKPILFALLLIVIVTAPTLPSYYFGENIMYQCHDHVINMVRLWHAENAFNQGVFLPNWLTTFTFSQGSPVFLFLWFLPFYLGLPFRWIGLSLADTIKSLFLVSYIGSGLAIYLFAKRLTNTRSALITIPFYLLNPVRLNLIFTRCSLGESLAQMIIPLVFVLLLSRHRFSSILAIFLLSALALTHNLSFLFTLGLLLVWALVVAKDKLSRQKLALVILSRN